MTGPIRLYHSERTSYATMRPMYDRLDLEPVRGMHDQLPAEQTRLEMTRAQLESVLTNWGYIPIDLPVLERRELYLKKAGEELVGKLYDFVHHGRGLALRPEWTASVLRAYLRYLQGEPLPVRLRYGGPVFRYERPQRGTYRQFTQIGVELIGGHAPRGDAEVIALACEGLAKVGVREWTLTIGHVGIARSLLAGLNLPERTASRLLWSMERLRRGNRDSLREQLQASGGLEGVDERFELGPLVELPDEQLSELLTTTIRAMGLSLESTSRAPEAIVERLIRKMRRADPEPHIEQALGSLERLSAAYGEPEHALAVAERLLHDLNLPTTQLDDLRQIVALVRAQGIEPPHLRLDLGLSRGLHYYTGMIFEIDSPDGLQLCGGGRYDELVGALRGEAVSAGQRSNVPAVGFAYGLERVDMYREQRVSGLPSLLVAAPNDDYAVAMRVADELRRKGYRVLLDARSRSIQANVRDADRRGCKALVVVGDTETHVLWHELGSDGQTTVQQTLLADVPMVSMSEMHG
jgi:histidyl-tRNA synthetase